MLTGSLILAIRDPYRRIVWLFFGGAALVSLLFYPSMTTAALILDRRLDLAEQLATATETVRENSDEPVAWGIARRAATGRRSASNQLEYLAGRERHGQTVTGFLA